MNMPERVSVLLHGAGLFFKMNFILMYIFVKTINKQTNKAVEQNLQ